MKLTKKQLLDLDRMMLRIRAFETETSKGAAANKVQGFVHLYLGQEAVATGVCANLKDTDFITSTHRGHGHIIGKGADMKPMMAELYGRKTGYCHGKGGSMHIASPGIGILGANGIVGGGFNIAAGAALSSKYLKTNAVTVCFFGDGSSNEGTFHEALNIAGVWKLPVVFVCENNLYGETCSQEKAMAIKDISIRAAGYGMPGLTADGNDVLEVYETSKEAIERARNGEGPSLIEYKTYRWHGHFEGDMCLYRTKEEVDIWMKKEPVKRLEDYLLQEGIASQTELDAIRAEVDEEIKEAVEFAENSPFPELEEALLDVYSDIVEEGR